MDIATWLRDLGLERYERAFRENEIDAEVLPELTEAHLATDRGRRDIRSIGGILTRLWHT